MGGCPKEYVPPVQVCVAAQRKAIPLDENEGIYVRDIKTGKVMSSSQKGGERSHSQTFLLDPGPLHGIKSVHSV